MEKKSEINSKIKLTVITGIFALIGAIITGVFGIIPYVFPHEKVEIISFELDSDAVEIGESLKVSWETSNAKEVYLEIDGKREEVSKKGSIFLHPKSKSSLYLLAKNRNETDDATLNFTVIEKEKKGKPEIPKRAEDYRKPQSEIKPQSTKLSQVFPIKGSIINENGMGLKDVKIIFNSKEDVTDQNGQFQINSSDNFEGKIIVSKKGYNPNPFTDYITPPEENIVITLTEIK